MPNKEKKKYIKQAQESKKKRYNIEKKTFERKIFDFPKKPNSGYSIYLKEKIPKLKRAKPNTNLPNLIKEIAKSWTELKEDDKIEYNKKGEEEQKLFKKNVKMFKKRGYYFKENNEEEDENDGETKKIQKKRRPSKVIKYPKDPRAKKSKK